jgi:hypothetical protein
MLHEKGATKRSSLRDYTHLADIGCPISEQLNTSYFFRKVAKSFYRIFIRREKKEKEKITRAQTPLHCVQHYYTNLVTKLTKPRLHYCSQLHYMTKQNWKLRKTKKNTTLMEKH